jgi:hypothetical protein
MGFSSCVSRVSLGATVATAAGCSHYLCASAHDDSPWRSPSSNQMPRFHDMLVITFGGVRGVSSCHGAGLHTFGTFTLNTIHFLLCCFFPSLPIILRYINSFPDISRQYGLQLESWLDAAPCSRQPFLLHFRRLGHPHLLPG